MSNRYNEKTLERRRPNGFSIELNKVWAKNEPESDACFTVEEASTDGYGDYDGIDIEEFETEAEARKYFEERCASLADTPNWEAQAAYDEAHGTINGEDPGVVAMREACGEC